MWECEGHIPEIMTKRPVQKVCGAQTLMVVTHQTSWRKSIED